MITDYFKKDDRGFVKLIILIIILILLLSYLGINIQKIAESDTGRANFGYVWQLILEVWGWLADIWNKYLAGIFSPIWDKLQLGAVWDKARQILPN